MSEIIKVTIDKLVYGGQALAQLEDGRKVFIWNALPGEEVEIRLTKSKKDFAEAIATKIIKKSTDRLEPIDLAFMSTSPWQIIKYEAENDFKKDILREVFDRENIQLTSDIAMYSLGNDWHYRNKMEYSFYGDNSGLHLALYDRGTHRKQIVESSSIARHEIDSTAQKVLAVLRSKNIRAGDLKTIILRCDEVGNVAVALFTKNQKFPRIQELGGICRGVCVIYSNPKSPASIRTKDLYSFGDTRLSDDFYGLRLEYDVFSFFQVNLGVFRLALDQIRSEVGDSSAVDMYCGVGVIGLCQTKPSILVEIDSANVEFAKINASMHANQNLKIIEASSEKALDYINSEDILIVDPPRAGLHKDLIKKISQQRPPKIIYLSCNPATQARDIKMLEEFYDIKNISGYNFFPKTPHIESLAVLVRK